MAFSTSTKGYYHANRDEIESYLAQEEADADRLEAEHTGKANISS